MKQKQGGMEVNASKDILDLNAIPFHCSGNDQPINCRFAICNMQ